MKFKKSKTCPEGHRLPKCKALETMDSIYCLTCEKLYLKAECVNLAKKIR